MATIEERANELYCDADGYVKDSANDYMRLGFIKGAEEQRQIDIEKAWKAHCNLCHYKIVGGCEVYASYSHCPDVKLIKKAMEDEQ